MRYKYYSTKLRHNVSDVEELKPAYQSVYDPHKYGLPELKKYPMPDAAHVKSAIKFFNYVSPKDEKRLAQAILNRMKEYGISDVNVGPDNRFGKYYKPDDTLQHSSGPWDSHAYKQKIELPNGKIFYDYGNTDLSKIGSRLNGAIGEAGNKIASAVGAGNNMSDSPTLKRERHNQAVQQQKSMDDFTKKPVSEVIGNNGPKNNQGIVGTDKKKDSDSKDADKKAATTDDTKTGKKDKGGGSGKKGSGSKKSGSGKSGSGKASPGKASGGKSGKSGSGKSSSSEKSSDADSKKAAKEAKKQQQAQKDYQKELQKMKEENKKKQDEQFEQRRRENEKRWKAEEERMEKMRDTSRQSVSKETLSEIIEMLKDSDKEYAKKLLEGGRSKIDDYLDWLKESRKNNSK